MTRFFSSLFSLFAMIVIMASPALAQGRRASTYNPPYDPSKDYVNQAGRYVSAVLRGNTPITRPTNSPLGYEVVGEYVYRCNRCTAGFNYEVEFNEHFYYNHCGGNGTVYAGLAESGLRSFFFYLLERKDQKFVQEQERKKLALEIEVVRKLTGLSTPAPTAIATNPTTSTVVSTPVVTPANAVPQPPSPNGVVIFTRIEVFADPQPLKKIENDGFEISKLRATVKFQKESIQPLVIEFEVGAEQTIEFGNFGPYTIVWEAMGSYERADGQTIGEQAYPLRRKKTDDGYVLEPIVGTTAPAKKAQKHK